MMSLSNDGLLKWITIISGYVLIAFVAVGTWYVNPRIVENEINNTVYIERPIFINNSVSLQCPKLLQCPKCNMSANCSQLYSEKYVMTLIRQLKAYDKKCSGTDLYNLDECTWQLNLSNVRHDECEASLYNYSRDCSTFCDKRAYDLSVCNNALDSSKSNYSGCMSSWDDCKDDLSRCRNDC